MNVGSYKSPATRRYLRRFFPLMAAYVVVLWSVTAFVRFNDTTGALRTVLAVLPALPIIGVVGVMLQYLREEPDEYMRMRQVQAFLGATGITLAVTTVWGFLQQFDAVPPAPMYWTFMIWCGGLGLSQCARALADRREDR